jgi:hypothetical protein
MPSEPNFDAPKCDCRFLERLSREPSVPIEFDPKLNEYHIVGAGGGKTMIYHCPFCGGRAPDSRREELFTHITHAESGRLKALTIDLKTVDDVLKTFGLPDYDNPAGYANTKDDGAGRPITTYYRQLTFGGLSDSAYVNAIVGLNREVQFTFSAKEITALEGQA